ncbi:MAG TPA: hypothetical protein V6C72_04185, partial [Chroococcales cyanobacterium]
YFMISQALLLAAQEGARAAAKTPNLLNDESLLDSVRGFSTSGAAVNPNSVIYTALSGARLLSGGNQGDMPPGSSVRIVPFDGNPSQNINWVPGTVMVQITYPFQLMGNPFKGPSQPVKVAMSFSNPPVSFLNFPITETAVATDEVFQAEP